MNVNSCHLFFIILSFASSLHAIQIGIPGIPFNINVPLSSVFSLSEESKKAQSDEKVYRTCKVFVNKGNQKGFVDFYLKEGASVSPEVQAKLLREVAITKECLAYKKEHFSVEHETEKVLNAARNAVISAIPLVAAPFIIHFIRLYSKALEETGESLMCHNIETEQKFLSAAASAVVLLGAAGLVSFVRTICYIEKHTQKRELGPDYYRPKKKAVENIETLLHRTTQK